MGYNVLVEPREVEAKTSGGLYLPDQTKERDEFARMDGVLVAASPMAFTFEGDWPDGREEEKPKIGAHVIFSRYGGEEVTGKDGGKYWIMKDRNIAAVMEDDE